MGRYTNNSYFYKPDLGAHGEVEKEKFDDALDGADSQIQGNKDSFDDHASTSDAHHSRYTDSEAQAAVEGSVKLDDLNAPDDNTDLDASTTAHGLFKKLSGATGQVLNGLGNWISLKFSNFNSDTLSNLNSIISDETLLGYNQTVYTTRSYSSLQSALEANDGSNVRIIVTENHTLSSLASGDYTGITCEVQPGVVVTSSVTPLDFNITAHDGGQWGFDVDTTVNGNLRSLGNTSGVVAFDAVDGDETLTVNGSVDAGAWKCFGSSLTVVNNSETHHPEWFGSNTGEAWGFGVEARTTRGFVVVECGDANKLYVTDPRDFADDATMFNDINTWMNSNTIIGGIVHIPAVKPDGSQISIASTVTFGTDICQKIELRGHNSAKYNSEIKCAITDGSRCFEFKEIEHSIVDNVFINGNGNDCTLIYATKTTLTVTQKARVDDATYPFVLDSNCYGFGVFPQRCGAANNGATVYFQDNYNSGNPPGNGDVFTVADNRDSSVAFYCEMTHSSYPIRVGGHYEGGGGATGNSEKWKNSYFALGVKNSFVILPGTRIKGEGSDHAIGAYRPNNYHISEGVLISDTTSHGIVLSGDGTYFANTATISDKIMAYGSISGDIIFTENGSNAYDQLMLPLPETWQHKKTAPRTVTYPSNFGYQAGIFFSDGTRLENSGTVTIAANGQELVNIGAKMDEQPYVVWKLNSAPGADARVEVTYRWDTGTSVWYAQFNETLGDTSVTVYYEARARFIP